MCDLICDVITCCVRSCDMGKITHLIKSCLKNQKIRENMEVKKYFYINLPPKYCLDIEFITC